VFATVRSGDKNQFVGLGIAVRILLSEGSGLTSRQVATRLGHLGHHVEVLSSTQICLTRFTRHVRRVHLVPSFARSPLAWLAAANAIAKERGIDVLFPTQEQVAVLSARQQSLEAATVVPEFSSLRRVQDKVSAFRTLEGLGIPQPRSVVINNSDDLGRIAAFPVFVKRPISTASSGIRRALSGSELALVANAMGLGKRQLLVQTQCEGPLAMVQAVADRGRTVAYHANLRVLEGLGGGASLKESVALPTFREHLDRLVAALQWSGALSMDVIVSPQGPLVIDVNPRIVEPMNAHFSGVDLVTPMLDLARSEHPRTQPIGNTGVRSRQLLLAILGTAQQSNSRAAVIREVYRALRGEGELGRATEELTPVSGDLIAALPVIAATISTVASPALWRRFHSGAVGPYALTPEAWEEIVAAA
jgi:glutathione synthase/RimK-type ligase-like ATP-grasp enzyme